MPQPDGTPTDLEIEQYETRENLLNNLQKTLYEIIWEDWEGGVPNEWDAKDMRDAILKIIEEFKRNAR